MEEALPKLIDPVPVMVKIPTLSISKYPFVPITKVVAFGFHSAAVEKLYIVPFSVKVVPELCTMLNAVELYTYKYTPVAMTPLVRFTVPLVAEIIAEPEGALIVAIALFKVNVPPLTPKSFPVPLYKFKVPSEMLNEPPVEMVIWSALIANPPLMVTACKMLIAPLVLLGVPVVFVHPENKL